MTDREYLKNIVDALPEEKLPEAISRLIVFENEEFDKKKFDLVKDYVLEKYHVAFEELAK